jgi:sulfite reductase alpha subunit-like flavoprotein
MLTKLILEQKGVVYVCGKANTMAKEVHNALITILQPHVVDPSKFLDEMCSKGQYVLDVWG